ncbi:MAG TPA: hypothetical protein DCQ04_15865 [Actinobacteria bacterium]|nr:hypothetical protein [Actinomycetota bacterium]
MCWTRTVNWNAVEAIGVVLAFVATLGTLEIERRRRNRERTDRNTAERRSQAELLAAWAMRAEGDIRSMSEDQRVLPWWLAIQNGSHQPVYNVVVYRTKDETSMRSTDRYDLAAVIHVVPPGTWYFRSAPAEFPNLLPPPVELAFSDRAGVHWFRTLDGALVELQATKLYDHDLEGAEFPYLLREPTSVTGQ